MSTKVKICGVRNREDALAAAEAGADMVGLMFFENSPRHITVDTAAEISTELPAHVVRVGVFVNPSRDQVLEAISRCGLNLLQFHGEEPPGFCTQFGLMSVKAFRIQGAESLDQLSQYQTDAWLLDAWVPDKHGGSGARFNWDLAIEAKRFGKPIFLAGGLTPENVAEAVRRVGPFAVDVSSGVESAPGRKDHEKIKAFVKAAKTADDSKISGELNG